MTRRCAARAIGVVLARQRHAPSNLFGKNTPEFRRRIAEQQDASDVAAARAFGPVLRELIMCPLVRCVPTKSIQAIRARNRYSEQGMTDIVWKNRRKAQRIARERHEHREAA